MPQKADEYAKAMRLAVQNIREPTQAPGEGVSAHGRAAAADKMLQEKADAQRAQAEKEATESDARMRQLGVEIHQKLELLRDSDEYQPPRQEQIIFLKYCTGKNNAKVMVEKAGHYHQMAAAEAILARELYSFGARKYMQYGRTPGTKIGTVLLEARNEAAKNNGLTGVSKLHRVGKGKGRKGAAAKGEIGVKQIAWTTLRDVARDQGLEVFPSVNVENVALKPSE
jgi:hypothetical protein